MGILLTDREIEELLDIEFKNTYSGHVAEYQDVAFAQLEKVAKWLQTQVDCIQHEHCEDCDKYVAITVMLDDWQQLLTEARIDE